MNVTDDSGNSMLNHTVLETRSSELAARISSRELLGRHGELLIEHNGRQYRLRLTQSGKLILTA